MSDAMVAVRASDETGQRFTDVDDMPAEYTVRQMTERLAAELGLPRNEPYHARLETAKETRNLLDSEVVKDVVGDEDDLIVLERNAEAGA